MWLGPIRSLGGLCAVLAMAMACSPETDPETEPAASSGFTVYLARHAEKEAGNDPVLTIEGQARAEALADALEGAGIETIWSTDYRRTQATAAPLAQRLRSEVQTYDPSDLRTFAEELQGAGRTALVIGHSNTTPDLAAALGGEPGPPIDEPTEYDRLYVLSGVGSDTVRTEIRRYGASDGSSSD